ncbi:MAG: hypothetical protein IT373_08960 [Polyangiaceae bacterium]|nr:hypothetical protein [Polyangiaceae bacterium]
MRRPGAALFPYAVGALCAAALGVAAALAACRGDAQGQRWVLETVGAASLSLAPVRDEVELVFWADPAPVVAELPGGYVVVAATRPAPLWRALRLAAGSGAR